MANPPDLGRSQYFDLLSGTAKQNEIEEMQKKIALNESRRLPVDSVFTQNVLSVKVAGTSAVVVECVVDDAVVFDTTTGQVRNDAIGTSTFETRLTKSDGRWTIAESLTIDSKDGVQPCGG